MEIVFKFNKKLIYFIYIFFFVYKCFSLPYVYIISIYLLKIQLFSVTKRSRMFHAHGVFFYLDI